VNSGAPEGYIVLDPQVTPFVNKVNSGAPEGYIVLDPQVTPFVLLLLNSGDKS
jgi:hypothetical protein